MRNMYIFTNVYYLIYVIFSLSKIVCSLMFFQLKPGPEAAIILFWKFLFLNELLLLFSYLQVRFLRFLTGTQFSGQCRVVFFTNLNYTITISKWLYKSSHKYDNFDFTLGVSKMNLLIQPHYMYLKTIYMVL